jgi:hypothetical protein
MFEHCQKILSPYQVILSIIFVLFFMSCGTKKTRDGSITNAAKMSFVNKLLTIGNVKLNSVKNISFKVYNSGDQPLIITDVTADCKCSTPKWQKEEILPGDSSNIEVSFHPQIPGPIMQSITIFSNDGIVPQTLVFRAIVE